MFKPLNHITDQLNEAELVKPELEHAQRTDQFVFFTLQFAKQRILEFYCNFLQKVLRSWQVWRTWIGHRLPQLVSAAKKLEDVIFLENQIEWNAMRLGDCTNTLAADGTDSFILRMCCSVHKKHNKRDCGLLKEEVRCIEMLCLSSRAYWWYDRKSYK